jgi:hypothetical protein
MVASRADQQVIQVTYQSWADLDRAIAGLNEAQATAREPAFSSIAWTVGHLSQMVDSWLNVRFQSLPPQPLLSSPAFAMGSSGEVENWSAIVEALTGVQDSARRFLDSPSEQGLDVTVPYTGSIQWLRPHGLQLRHALLRIAAHHFGHIAEILTIRTRLGVGLTDDIEWGRSFV